MPFELVVVVVAVGGVAINAGIMFAVVKGAILSASRELLRELSNNFPADEMTDERQRQNRYQTQASLKLLLEKSRQGG